ncbi:MAG: Uma2 family endonuclease [Symploca sp. SIO2B6]|nr:Uma2 family endonuclease [Symploca sp. SIO2B6]
MVFSTDTTPKLSLAEFLEMPETKPAKEYINGKVYQKPMPQGKHSTLQGRLTTAINQVGESQQLVFAFPELRCTFGGRSLVPDISIFEWQRIPLDNKGEIENRFEISPDWVIEILSPEQTDARLTEKIIFCLNQGTKLGWLIDPKERLVITFQPKQQPEVKQDLDILPVIAVLEDWQLSAADLFQWLSFRRG